MKVLVIGLGSMGKRRIRNLQALGVNDIHGCDQNKKTAEEAEKLHGITLLPNLLKLKERRFDFAVISTPPGLHLRPITICAENRIPFFVELNLVTKEAEAIRKLIKKHKVLGLPSDTMLFDSDIIELKKLLDPKFKGYFIFHLGQNIRDWHPWQKPGQHFIFKPKTNGIREMLRIELPWIAQIFGDINAISAQGKRFETDRYGVDDFFSVALGFANGNRGIVVLDLLAPNVIKRMDIVSAKKIVTWNERKNMFEVQEKGGKKTTKALASKERLAKYKFHEDAYLEEMRHILAVVRGEIKSKLDFGVELQTLKLIDKIENAGKRIRF